MRVLVTGATGFIGRELIPVLEARGHSLTLTLRDARDKERLPDAKTDGERRSIVVGDIHERTDWGDALRGADVVVHLAAHAHVMDAGPDEEATFTQVNVWGTQRLVEQAIDAGVARFVLVSSVGAVTSQSRSRITEDTPCTPDTAYGRSKRAAERVLIERAAPSDMRWTVLRPTLVYGPGNPGNMKKLVSLVRSGLPIPLGSVQNRRSFTFVRNLTDIIEIALSHPNAADATFLVSDGDDLSTPQLIDKVAGHAGVRATSFSVPLPVLRVVARLADLASALTHSTLPFGTLTLRRLETSLYVDIEPLRDRLGWKPRFDMDEGLRCMLTPQ
jgi:nucleoside-diphosphate-sugar epimerase